MRILIIDDAAVLRTVFAGIARDLGHDIAGDASDLESGLRAARDLDPDAIVLDGRLGPGPLPAAVRSLRAVAPRAAVYVVAALDEISLVRDALAAGAEGAVLRPFVTTRIAAVLGTCR